MQFKFTALAFGLLAMLTTAATAAPAELPAGIVSNDVLDAWIASTDATITFAGDEIDPLAPRMLATRVVYCNTRTHNVCGGACTVYNGNARCLDAPNTQCISATTNVGFCDRAGCGGSCNQLSSCGTRLDGGFCYTPGTRSINVPFT